MWESKRACTGQDETSQINLRKSGPRLCVSIVQNYFASETIYRAHLLYFSWFIRTPIKIHKHYYTHTIIETLSNNSPPPLSPIHFFIYLLRLPPCTPGFLLLVIETIWVVRIQVTESVRVGTTLHVLLSIWIYRDSLIITEALIVPPSFKQSFPFSSCLYHVDERRETFALPVCLLCCCYRPHVCIDLKQDTARIPCKLIFLLTRSISFDIRSVLGWCLTSKKVGKSRRPLLRVFSTSRTITAIKLDRHQWGLVAVRLAGDKSCPSAPVMYLTTCAPVSGSATFSSIYSTFYW